MKRYRYVFLVLLVYLVYVDEVTCFKPEPNGVVMAMENMSVGLRVKRTDGAASQNTNDVAPIEEDVILTKEPRHSFGNKSLKPK